MAISWPDQILTAISSYLNSENSVVNLVALVCTFFLSVISMPAYSITTALYKYIVNSLLLCAVVYNVCRDVC